MNGVRATTGEASFAALLASSTGLKMNHVPYKGSGQATTDLLGGQVMVSIPGTAGMVGHIKAGKLRALAVTGSKRSPQLPDVPTVIESGVPGYEAYVWMGLLAPAAPFQRPRAVSAEARRIAADTADDPEPPDADAASWLELADLSRDTPYNTYTRPGLPPTPIAMPSLESLHAAVQPDVSGALFFVATGAGDGSHYFSKTLAEHNLAVRRYLRELRRR